MIENNFKLSFSRRELAKMLTIKMIKDLKKKEIHENSLKSKNDDEDV